MAQVKVFTSGNPDSLNIHYHFPGLRNDHNRSKEVLSACSAQVFNIAFNYAGDPEGPMRNHSTYENFIERIESATDRDALKEILETFENNVSSQTRGGVPQSMPPGSRKRVFSFHSAGGKMFEDLAERSNILLPSEGLVQGALHLDDLYYNDANEAMIELARMGLKQTIVNNASGDRAEATLPTLQSTENIKFIQTDTSHGSIPVEYINGETTALFS